MKISIALLFLALFARAASEAPLPDQTAQRIFARVFPLAFKVKTSPSADAPQASYGTGFVVDRQGLLITNYHVVSESILEPKKNKIFVLVGDKPIAGQVLAIDVVHDLSLIRIDKTFESELSFAPEKPAQGEPIYSIGQPEDLNMSIAPGTYNDEIDFGDYKIIHLSAPINSGMSGGPMVNRKGELIGVNVSKLLSANNVSFAVPARFAQELYRKHRDLKDHPATFWSDMETQLTELQQTLTEGILQSTETTKIFRQWNVPQMPRSLKCWSAGDRPNPEEKDMFDTNEEICDLEHSSYLSSENASGTYSFALKSFENKKLNSWQFYELLSEERNNGAFKEAGPRDPDEHAGINTRGDCTSDVVVNKAGLSFKVAYCIRAYGHFPGLQDAHIAAITIGDKKHALATELELEGFTPANIKKITRKLLEGISKGAL